MVLLCGVFFFFLDTKRLLLFSPPPHLVTPSVLTELENSKDKEMEMVSGYDLTHSCCVGVWN